MYSSKSKPDYIDRVFSTLCSNRWRAPRETSEANASARGCAVHDWERGRTHVVPKKKLRGQILGVKEAFQFPFQTSAFIGANEQKNSFEVESPRLLARPGFPHCLESAEKVRAPSPRPWSRAMHGKGAPASKIGDVLRRAFFFARVSRTILRNIFIAPHDAKEYSPPSPTGCNENSLGLRYRRCKPWRAQQVLEQRWGLCHRDRLHGALRGSENFWRRGGGG